MFTKYAEISRNSAKSQQESSTANTIRNLEEICIPEYPSRYQVNPKGQINIPNGAKKNKKCISIAFNYEIHEINKLSIKIASSMMLVCHPRF